MSSQALRSTTASTCITRAGGIGQHPWRSGWYLVWNCAVPGTETCNTSRLESLLGQFGRLWVDSCPVLVVSTTLTCTIVYQGKVLSWMKQNAFGKPDTESRLEPGNLQSWHESCWLWILPEFLRFAWIFCAWKYDPPCVRRPQTRRFFLQQAEDSEE